MTAAVANRSFARAVSRDRVGLAVHVLLLVALLFVLLTLFTLLADVAARGGPILLERGADFLASPTSSRPDQAGVIQGIVGSLMMAVLVALSAFPVGVMAAVYLEEYAVEGRLTRLIDVTVRNLAGVPSVVYGLLGLSLFVVGLRDVTGGRSLISGGLTLAVLVLPIVIITSAEAIRAVPRQLREAGYGLGASRWQVVRRLVLPAAAPGILTGTILALSRALGETAPLILVGAVLGGFSTGSKDLLEQLGGRFTALPVIVFDWTRRPQADFRELAAAAILVLLAVTLSANLLAIVLRNRLEQSR